MRQGRLGAMREPKLARSCAWRHPADLICEIGAAAAAARGRRPPPDPLVLSSINSPMISGLWKAPGP